MPTIKNAHYEKNFALFDKTALDHDSRLSWAAKGILSYVLAQAAGWEMNVTDLVSRSVDGKTVVYSALKELRHFGYATYQPKRVSDQISEWCYYVYATPEHNPSPEDPTSIPLGKKHQGTDKRKFYRGGYLKLHSENLNVLEKQAIDLRSENLKEGGSRSENLHSENLNTNKNKKQGCKKYNLWDTILISLQKTINRPSFDTWLRPTRLLEQNGRGVVIGVPSEDFVYWLQDYYTTIIQDELEKQIGQRPDITFQVVEQ